MKMHVDYEDGTAVDYKVKPRHLVAYEEVFGTEFQESAKSAYSLAHIASESPLSFTDWLRAVEDIMPVREKGDPEELKAEGVTEAGPPVPTE